MDTLEGNKIAAAVLVAGIAFFMTGLIGDTLVHSSRLKETAIKIDIAPQAASGGGPAKEEALPPIAPLLAKADPAAGEAVTKKLCVACHTFNEGGKAGVGPNLYNVVGGPHAHMEGFNYSAAIKEKKGPWTYAELNEWLHKPSSYAPGTRMGFAGISSAQERANVIDYLHTLSAKPEPLPPPGEPVQPATQGGQKGAPQPGAAPAAGAPKAPSSNAAAQPEGAAKTMTPTEQRATSTTPTMPLGTNVGPGSPTPAAKSP